MIKEAPRGVWCDLCKEQYGRSKTGQWNAKAQAQAWVIEVSEGVRAKGLTRARCFACVRLFVGSNGSAAELMRSLQSMSEAGIAFQAKFEQGVLNV